MPNYSAMDDLYPNVSSPTSETPLEEVETELVFMEERTVLAALFLHAVITDGKEYGNQEAEVSKAFRYMELLTKKLEEADE